MLLKSEAQKPGPSRSPLVPGGSPLFCTSSGLWVLWPRALLVAWSSGPLVLVPWSFGAMVAFGNCAGAKLCENVVAFWNRAGPKCENAVVFGILQARNAGPWSFLESCRREMRESGRFLKSCRREMRDCGGFWSRAGAKCETVVVCFIVQARNARMGLLLESCKREMRDCGRFYMDRPRSS